MSDIHDLSKHRFSHVQGHQVNDENIPFSALGDVQVVELRLPHESNQGAKIKVFYKLGDDLTMT
jgi:hypothetical protein